VRVIAVPYHLDEHLPGLDFPLSADEVVTTDLPPGDVWDRLAAGARDLDPPEVSYLASAAIRRREVAGLRPADLPDRPFYLHLDLDVIDPAEVPGLRYPAPGGASPARLADALRWLLGSGLVAAVGLACTWYAGHDAAARVAPALEATLAGI
jgi:arginase